MQNRPATTIRSLFSAAAKRTNASASAATISTPAPSSDDAAPAMRVKTAGRKRTIIEDDDEDDDGDGDGLDASDAKKLATPDAKESDNEAAADDAAAAKPREAKRIFGAPIAPPAAKVAKVADAEAPCAGEVDDIPYAELCDVFSKVEATSKRLQITALVRDFLASVLLRTRGHRAKHAARTSDYVPPVLACVYLCVNRICPDYEGHELGVGEGLLLKAVADATGSNASRIRATLATVGDLGDVAQSCRGSQPTMFKPKPLTVIGIFRTLKEIAAFKGSDSQRFKTDKIKTLLVACRGTEAKYLVRSLEGKLRIGLAEKTVLTAMAHAFIQTEPKRLGTDVAAAAAAAASAARRRVDDRDRERDADDEESDETLRRAQEQVAAVFSEVPSYDCLVGALLEYPLFELHEKLSLQPGVPTKPMLAHPTKAISEVLERFDGKKFTCEYKYDGERAQLHYDAARGICGVFSRNSENLSEKYPDIVRLMTEKFAAGGSDISHRPSFVMDCEAVAWDRERSAIMPFQVLSTRKRKDVKEGDIKVNVCVYAFDLIYFDGVSLLRHTLEERRRILRSNFHEIDGEFMMARSRDTDNVDEVAEFLEEAVGAACEGLMVKTLGADSTYEPSRRSRKWLKLKKDYLESSGATGLGGDSLDLIVVGGYTGKGKRTGQYGGFLLACYDDDSESFQSICKIGTGFSEEALAAQSARLAAHVIAAPKPYYDVGDCRPDVWFDAVAVWEVKAADLSISPIYRAAAGLVDAGKGISLRFPRFLRDRDDKRVEEATTASQVAEMYERQQAVSAQRSSSDKADGDGDNGDDE